MNYGGQACRVPAAGRHRIGVAEPLSLGTLLRGALCAVLLLACQRLHAAEDDGWISTAQPFLKTYCWTCHGADQQKGDLNLQRLSSAAELTAQAEELPTVIRRLSQEEMPPSRSQQPTAQERAAIVSWLKLRLNHGHTKIADDPGVVIIPHLTPTQYERAVRDLTGLDLAIAAQLPHEGGDSEGFDNVGAAQAITPMHLESYLATARLVASHARILPGLPLEWLGSNPGGEPQTTFDYCTMLMANWLNAIPTMYQRTLTAHMDALKPLLPNLDAWFNSVGENGNQVWGMEWLIVYLDAAWQYQHRAELGHPSWTPDDTAASFTVPLRKETLGRLIRSLTGKAQNLYWRRIQQLWLALPPPPVTDANIRKQCWDIISSTARRMPCSYNNGVTQDDETQVLQPFEDDETSILKHGGEAWTVMMEEGRRPFRFHLKGRRDIYLVTTDAGDGSDNDIMIWEHGVLTRDGKEEPWTGLTVTDEKGAAVAWGSHPMGAAANLPKDAIAVHAPAVLHLTFPVGTTVFRVDARADPIYAKNGSMQVSPFDHPPSEDQLHFIHLRWVFGAPKSSRMYAILGWSLGLKYGVSTGVGGDPGLFFDDPYNLLPADVRQFWGMRNAAPPPESSFGDGFPNDIHQSLWFSNSVLFREYATPAMLTYTDHMTSQIRATIEMRDALSIFIVATHPANVSTIAFAAPSCEENRMQNKGFDHLENAAQAFTIVPTGLHPDQAAHYQALLAAAKSDEERLRGCAREHIGEFARRAWRREPSAKSIDKLLVLYQQGRDAGLCYETSVKRSFVGVLVSPFFLYREQSARQQEAPYDLNGRDLAERLAFVLWGSIPDAELLKAGTSGSLQTAEGLRTQVARMIADQRSQALAVEFAGQFLLFAGFDTFTGPDPVRFPQFTPEIRAAMYQECLSYFSDLFANDLPLTNIIDSNYTFLNQDLAAFYGIGGVDGPKFRRVQVNPAQRGGVLGMGAILARASLPLRTSPIKRGNWVLSHLIGTPPSPPPAVVAQISTQDHDGQGLSIVQQMQRHRSDPKCMSCHERIDPLGVPLESFDALGRLHKTLDDGKPVDDQQATADGTLLQGFAGLKKYLMAAPQRDKIMRNLCTKFVGYALGRALMPSDDALIAHLMSDLEAHGWRSSVLLMDVLCSPEFTKRRDEALASAPAQEKP